MCDQDPQVSHLPRALASLPMASGEDRHVYRCGSWVFKRERTEDSDSRGTNRLERDHGEAARDSHLPNTFRIPRMQLIPWEGEEVLAVEFVAGLPMRECERAYGLECPAHDETVCLSAQRMIEIRDQTGLYDFADGNVIRDHDGALVLIDLTLCAFDQPLNFEEQ